MLLSTLLVAFAIVAYASYDEFTLGISLGKRDLIVVQSLENGSTSLIARVSVNATYTDWFEQTIKLPEQQRSTVDTTALHEALLAAHHAATQVLQQHTQFSIAALPRKLEDLVPEALSTLNLLAPLETYASYTVRPERAVVYAYELGTCEAANLPEGCDPDEINGEALWLDFDAGLLNSNRHSNDSRSSASDLLCHNRIATSRFLRLRRTTSNSSLGPILDEDH
ncbi:unnamed protein product, partial [Aureobasidium mustum]